MSKQNEGKAAQVKEGGPANPSRPGWATMPSTSAFRAINFELFVRPNKYVMAVGAATFLGTVGYMLYMNLTNDKSKTYVTIDADGSLSSRPRVSKWE